MDLLNQRNKYMAETDYRRSQIEPAMQFTEKAINNYQKLNSELFDNLQPIEKIEAYWEDGQTDKAYVSIEDAIKAYPERNRAIVNKLASFRSLKTPTKLEGYLYNDDYKDTHEMIVNAMALMPSSETLDTLLDVVKNSKYSAQVRRAGVQALEWISYTTFDAAKTDKIKSSLIPLLHKPLSEEQLEDEKRV